MDSKRGIGKDNSIPWHIPEDFKWFKMQTDGKIVIMGDTTYYTLPKKSRPLPNRTNVVLTMNDDNVKSLEGDGCIVVRSIKEVYDKFKDEDCFIIGGAQVYSEFISFADKMYLTFVKGDFKCDRFFPVYDKRIWRTTYRTYYGVSEKGYKYSFNIIEKVKPEDI